jgi:shikimate kinase
VKSVILIGFKSCGKTSVGALLAQQLQVPFMDTDDLIAQRHFRNTGIRFNTADIYRIRGEIYFRNLEKQVVMGIDTIQTTQVIATGGGSIIDEDTRQHLKQLGLVVHLSLSLDRLKTRIQAQPSSPLFGHNPDGTRFNDLYTQRLPLYQQLADIECDTENKSVAAVAMELLPVLAPNLSSRLR